MYADKEKMQAITADLPRLVCDFANYKVKRAATLRFDHGSIRKIKVFDLRKQSFMIQHPNLKKHSS